LKVCQGKYIYLENFFIYFFQTGFDFRSISGKIRYVGVSAARQPFSLWPLHKIVQQKTVGFGSTDSDLSRDVIHLGIHAVLT
jgi:hypothetical protein